MNFTYNYVRPKNKKEVKMWNYYSSDDTWDFIKIRYWPADIARAVIEKKLKYGTRFRVFLYLVGNGMSPNQAKDEVLKMGADYFDWSAKQHVKNLHRDLNRNMEKWQYWDERERKVLRIADTAPNGTAAVSRKKRGKWSYPAEVRNMIEELGMEDMYDDWRLF